MSRTFAIRPALRNLLIADQAAALMEFALMMPLVLLLLFASIDVARFFVWVDKARRCSIITTNAASQQSTLTSSTLSTILQQTALQTPSGNWTDPSNQNGLVVSVITNTGTKTPVIALQVSYPTNKTLTSKLGPGPSGSTCTPPNTSSFPPATVPFTIYTGDVIVVGEVFYNFKSIPVCKFYGICAE